MLSISVINFVFGCADNNFNLSICYWYVHITSLVALMKQIDLNQINSPAPSNVSSHPPPHSHSLLILLSVSHPALPSFSPYMLQLISSLVDAKSHQHLAYLEAYSLTFDIPYQILCNESVL